MLSETDFLTVTRCVAKKASAHYTKFSVGYSKHRKTHYVFCNIINGWNKNIRIHNL